MTNRYRYWRVDTSERKFGTFYKSHLQNVVAQAINAIIEKFKPTKRPLTGDVLNQLQGLKLPNDFVLDVRPELLDQPCFANGTGCLIGGDRILTCAHLDNDDDDPNTRLVNNPQKYRILFGFRNGDVVHGQYLPAWQVRTIQS